MKKKLVTGLLMCAMVGTMLTGCGDNKEVTKVDESTIAVIETEEITKTEDLNQETEETKEVQEPVTYVEENGLTFSQELSGTMQGYRFNGDNVSEYEFIDTEWEISGIAIEDAEEEGYLTVTVEEIASGYQLWDDTNGVYRNGIMLPALGICDTYTGIIVPSASTMGEMDIAYSTEIEWEGQTYTVGYTKSEDWTVDDWIQGTDGAYTALATCKNTYIITIPEDYDGLAFIQAPFTEPPKEDEEYGVVDDSETEYIMDDWKDGSILILMQDVYEALNQ
ncbi:MAG: hypothetical protein J6D08_07260 [Lachnospiraceae bacterium]|nr:hypothetical protein [Lachnospiraceae bacterium]